MRVKEEGIFKMHSEDDDYNLPLSFTHRRHEQQATDGASNLMVKNWRLKERVSITFEPCRNFFHFHLFFFKTNIYFNTFLPDNNTDENSISCFSAMPECRC